MLMEIGPELSQFVQVRKCLVILGIPGNVINKSFVVIFFISIYKEKTLILVVVVECYLILSCFMFCMNVLLLRLTHTINDLSF